MEDVEDNVQEQETEDRDRRRGKERVYQRILIQETTHHSLNIETRQQIEETES